METLHFYNFTPSSSLVITKEMGKDPVTILPRQTVAYALPDSTYAARTYIQDQSANSPLIPLRDLQASKGVKRQHGFRGVFYTMALTCNEAGVSAFVYALPRTDAASTDILGEYVATVNGWRFSWIRTSVKDPIPVGFAPFVMPTPGPAPAPMPAGMLRGAEGPHGPIVLEESNFGQREVVADVEVDFLRVCYPKPRRGGCDYSEESHYAYSLDRVFATPRGCML